MQGHPTTGTPTLVPVPMMIISAVDASELDILLDEFRDFSCHLIRLSGFVQIMKQRVDPAF